ncbi:MAG: ABC transporter substrate-binding protein [Defluviitaleaceae bacterium]|nr:ABC transporter substrate-binding protein [Defluviitaleaceae bacterium]
MKKWIALLFIGLLVGCGSQVEDELTTVRLSEVTRSVFYAPQYVAMALGFFEEEGLLIELVTSDGADNVMVALLSGAADIGLSGPEAAIYVYNAGRVDHAVIFAGLTSRDGSFLIGRSPSFTWDDLRGAHVLPGRRGGMPFMVLESVLMEKGIVADVQFDTSIQFAAVVGAFLGGTGDFVTAFEPVASTIELEGRGYVVASVGMESRELPYTTYYALESFIYENPDVIQGFTNAIARGQAFVQHHSPESIATTIAPFFPDAELEILASAISRYQVIGAYALTPLISEAAFYQLQAIMINAGELTYKASFETLVSNEFAERVESD